MFGIRVGRRPSRRLTGADRSITLGRGFSSQEFLSWRDRSPLRPPGRVEQSRGVRSELQPRPRTGGLSPLTPLDWPMIGAAARVDSAREAVRKDARHPGGCRTSVTAGLTPYPNPTRRPTSTRMASKDAGLVSQDTVCPHMLTRERDSEWPDYSGGAIPVSIITRMRRPPRKRDSRAVVVALTPTPTPTH